MSFYSRTMSVLPYITGRSVLPKFALAHLNTIIDHAVKTRDIKNSYSSANTGRTRSDWSVTYTDPYSDITNLKKAINRSRELYKSNDTYRPAINTIVDNVIGTGLRVKPSVVDEDGQKIANINEQLEVLWEEYTKPQNWDATNKMPFTGAGQQLIYRTRLIAGNTFLNAVINNKNEIPLMWQIFQLDRLNCAHDSYLRTESFSENIAQTINGINLDKYGAPMSYWINGIDNPISATNIIHVYKQLYPEQYIGEPVGVASMASLYDIGELSEDYTIKSRAIARLVFQLMSSDEFADGVETSTAGNPIIPEVAALRTKEKPEPVKMPDNISETLEPLLKMKKHEALSGMGTSYTTVTRDLNGVNFAASKFIDIAEWRFYLPERSDIVGDCYQPMYDRFIQFAVMSGKISGLNEFEYYKNTAKYNKAVWAGDEREDVDPVKTARANELNLKNNVETLAHLLHKKGKTLRDHFREVQEMKVVAAEFGIDVDDALTNLNGGNAKADDKAVVNAFLESLIDTLEKDV